MIQIDEQDKCFTMFPVMVIATVALISTGEEIPMFFGFCFLAGVMLMVLVWNDEGQLFDYDKGEPMEDQPDFVVEYLTDDTTTG